jgi:hypothetical protein
LQIDPAFPDYDNVQLKIKETEEQFLNWYLTRADEYATEKNYTKAIAILTDVDELFVENEKILKKITEIRIKEIESGVAERKDRRDNIGAIEYANSMLTDNNQEVNAKLNEIIAEYKKIVIEEIKLMVKEDNVEAQKRITRILNIFPTDTELQDLQILVASYEPMHLVNLTPSAKEGNISISKVDEVKDNFGNAYKETITAQSQVASISFRIDKKYDVFSAKIAIIYNERSAKTNTTVRVYCDGLYVGYLDCEAGMDPHSFEQMVTGVDVLKIEFAREQEFGTTNAFMADMIVRKK